MFMQHERVTLEQHDRENPARYIRYTTDIYAGNAFNITMTSDNRRAKCTASIMLVKYSDQSNKKE